MRTLSALAPLLTLVACGSTPSAGAARGDDGGARVTLSAPDAGDDARLAGDENPDAAAASEASPTREAHDGGTHDGRASDGSVALSATPPDTWTWIPYPESRCGNGSATGIGVNPHEGATQLLIYLQGGGACTDADSCWGASATAENMSGYSGSDFASDPTLGAEIFQRATTGNPFRDATLVFVPYCTGDLHIGTGLVSYDVSGVMTPTYFHGASNIDAFTTSLAATYTGLSRVFLTGVSAGGFGSFLNQDAVAHAFGGVRVDVVDDSGPALGGTGIPTDWSARLPATCATCVDAATTFAFMRKTYPTSRYGFLTFQTDTVLPLFFGETDAAFATLLQQFVTGLSSDPNTRAFVDTSSGHVVLEETDATAAPYILPWLTQLANDDPSWATVRY